MTERKQSVTSDQILERDKSSKLPTAGAPRISNFQYDGTPAQDVPEEINDPVDQIDTLPAPRNVSVVSQEIKFAPDGTQYVTVTIEFDEVKAASGYQSRVAKA